MRVGVIGGAGYTGGELIRLLLTHPSAKLRAVSSASHAGKPLHEAHPNLRGLSDLLFSADLDFSELDAVFLAEGHGKAMARVKELSSRKNLKLIDLSGDFRLKDAAAYERFYGRPHEAPEFLPRFVYGLSELDRGAIASASWIANPGCFATAVCLAVGPLAKIEAGALKIDVCATTGSSGSGALASQTTHHPVRDGSLRAYRPLSHQHVPEIEQCLSKISVGADVPALSLVPVSGPFVRGIYAVCQFELPGVWTERRLREAYAGEYAQSRFVRLLDEPPSLVSVRGSNYCDLFVCVKGRSGVAIAAIDNLVKGAAGQAVQNLNLMCGFDEAAGLAAAGAYP